MLRMRWCSCRGWPALGALAAVPRLQHNPGALQAKQPRLVCRRIRSTAICRGAVEERRKLIVQAQVVGQQGRQVGAGAACCAVREAAREQALGLQRHSCCYVSGAARPRRIGDLQHATCLGEEA